MNQQQWVIYKCHKLKPGECLIAPRYIFDYAFEPHLSGTFEEILGEKFVIVGEAQDVVVIARM